METIIIILAIAMGTLGSVIVYLSWKRHSTKLALIGWACLFASLPFWILSQGAEYGLVFALCLPAIYVWINIFREQTARTHTKHIEKPTNTFQWQSKKIVRNSGYVIYHLILLMLASSLIATATIDLIPINRPTQLAIGIIVLPLIWAALSFWHLVSVNKLSPLAFSFASSLASGLYLFI